MSIEEDAKSFIGEYLKVRVDYTCGDTYDVEYASKLLDQIDAKQCTLIAIDRIINIIKSGSPESIGELRKYLLDLKKEIKKQPDY